MVAKIGKHSRINKYQFELPTRIVKDVRDGVLSSDYSKFFNLFLGFVDETGGYNGKTSESFGAVTDDGPELLKKLIKQ